MDGCGTGCVIAIWVGFAWPAIVTFVIFERRANTINGRLSFFVQSILAGYASMLLLNFLIAAGARALIPDVTRIGASDMATAFSLTWAGAGSLGWLRAHSALRV